MQSSHLQESFSRDSEMIGEASKYYDLDHLLTRPSNFAPEDFQPSIEVRDHDPK